MSNNKVKKGTVNLQICIICYYNYYIFCLNSSEELIILSLISNETVCTNIKRVNRGQTKFGWCCLPNPKASTCDIIKMLTVLVNIFLPLPMPRGL